MNKKYVLLGVLFWASVSGYMGMRILDSYTEDAVAAALSGLSASAEEIRFSFLKKTLDITGLEYDLPDPKTQRKGRIERIEVQDFNRKILFVLPRMAEYSAETLPKVAERVTVTGWTETLHEKEDKIASSIKRISIEGWYQRLGLVLDRYARFGAGKQFYEEAARCRMAGASVEGISSEKNGGTASRFSALRIFFPRGIVPPAQGEKVHPQDISLEGLSCSEGTGTFSAGGIQVLGLQLPHPDIFDALPQGGGEGKSQKAERPGLLRLLSSGWRDRLPLASLSVQSASFRDPEGKEELGMESGSVMLARKDGGYGLDLAVRALGGRNAEELRIMPSLPEAGMLLDAGVRGSMGPGETEFTASYDLRGLGRGRLGARVKGNVPEVLEVLMGKKGSFGTKNLVSLSLRDAEFTHDDSGLAALLLLWEAKERGCTPQELWSRYREEASAMASSEGVLQAEAGRILLEQLERPGKAGVRLREETSLAALVMQMLMSPEKLPLQLTSEPGPRPMSSYFPR